MTSPTSSCCYSNTQIASDRSERVCCNISFQKTAALVVLLIGTLFLVTGIYLLLSGIGTIAATTTGCSLIVGGSIFLFGAAMIIRKKICYSNSFNIKN
jgi:hypothetical protein